MEELRMSVKERRKMELLSQVKKKKQSLLSVALQLRVSYRQMKRVWKRYKAQGDAGLVHLGRGRRSNRARPLEEQEAVLELYAKRYPDFGPVLASEHLKTDDHIEVDHETLRRWLLANGLWEQRRNRAQHRKARERRGRWGELVQMDGSEHDWFEGRGPRLTMMVMIDDATNRTLSRFYPAEDTASAYDIFERYARQYGLPGALYPDRDSIYICTREARIDEDLQGIGPETQFARAMRELGVGLIPAYSPQAKGRVERRHQVFQDRLVKEMRLRGISTMEAANDYLDQEFLKDLNKRFTLPPREPHNAHRPCPARTSLDLTLCWKETRVVAKDWTIRWKNLRFQIPDRYAHLRLPGHSVDVCELRDGRRLAFYKGKNLCLQEAPAPMPALSEPTIPATFLHKPPSCHKPSLDHPWRSRGIRTRPAPPHSSDELSMAHSRRAGGGAPEKPALAGTTQRGHF
jgi:hypothetical protein